MIKIALSVLLFIYFPIAGCYPQIQKNTTEQKANHNLYSWDFGTVKEGKVLKHIFILRNETQAPLNIKDVNTSCGCTVSKVAKKTLLPGEETSVEVKFNTKGYSGPTQQYVYVHTDSLDTSTSLSINSERSRTIDTSTSSLDFARDDPERVKRVEGSLSVNSERSRTIDNPVIRYIIKADVVK